MWEMLDEDGNVVEKGTKEELEREFSLQFLWDKRIVVDCDGETCYTLRVS